jgi:hypothetical protein
MDCRMIRSTILLAVLLPTFVADGAETQTLRPPVAAPTLAIDPVSVRFATTTEPDDGRAPNFQRHIVPLLGRLGCNGRACHGSFQGRGGFRLSMFGYDFDLDHKALLAGEPPRVNTAKPRESQILLKPTNADDHEGGKRYEVNGWEDHLLRAWIQAGAPQNSKQAGNFVRLEVVPAEINFARLQQTMPLKAFAHWSDGTIEDVTCLTRFSSNDDVVAKVTPAGEITAAGRGDTSIICSYDRAVVSVAVTLPVSDKAGDRYPPVPTPTKIDELVVAKLRKLGIVPAPVVDDATFLRRVSLDMTGTLPVPSEVAAFLADKSPDKRARKIDELL